MGAVMMEGGGVNWWSGGGGGGGEVDYGEGVSVEIPQQ